MAKKKSTSLFTYTPILGALLAIVAIVMFVGPFVAWQTDVSLAITSLKVNYTISGFVMAFGGNANLAASVGETDLSEYLKDLAITVELMPGILVSFIAFAVAAVLSIAAVFLKAGMLKKIVLVLAGLLLLAGAALAFCSVVFYNASLEVEESECALGWAAIVTGAVGILGGLIDFGAALVK